MRYYTTFFKKEFMESIRVYRLFILVIVFFIFGVMSPVIAKLTPELLSSLASEFKITVPEPTAIDSWVQFFTNVTQLGLITLAIIFSGTVSSELSKGTLVILLTKGMPRSAVILSKLSCAALLWTISLLLSFFVNLGYTIYLFPSDEVINLAFSVFCLWVFGIFLLSLLYFFAALVKSSYICLLLTGSGIVILTLMNLVSKLKKYNPYTLITENVNLLTNQTKVSELYYALGIGTTLSCIFVTASVLLFKRRQM